MQIASKAKFANELLKARAVSGELNHPGGWGAGEKYSSEDRSEICMKVMFIEDPECSAIHANARLLQTLGRDFELESVKCKYGHCKCSVSC